MSKLVAAHTAGLAVGLMMGYIAGIEGPSYFIYLVGFGSIVLMTVSFLQDKRADE